MVFDLIPVGSNVPDDIYVIIEISANSDPVKYEINKDNGLLFVDRFISTTMFYPCNYGYINNTLSLDGDPVDVLVKTPYPIKPNSVILCRPVGMLKMIDESGTDIKVVAVPHTAVCKDYDSIQDIDDVPQLLRTQIKHFFEHYKDLEDGKWANIQSWENAASAKEEIVLSCKRAQKKIL